MWLFLFFSKKLVQCPLLKLPYKLLNGSSWIFFENCVSDVLDRCLLFPCHKNLSNSCFLHLLSRNAVSYARAGNRSKLRIDFHEPYLSDTIRPVPWNALFFRKIPKNDKILNLVFKISNLKKHQNSKIWLFSDSSHHFQSIYALLFKFW